MTSSTFQVAIDSPTADALRRAGPLIVTGGEGYVGSAIRQCLRQHDIPGHSFDTRSSAKEERADLRDADTARKTLRTLEPAVVIHCATASALAYGDRFIESAQADIDILRNVLENVPPTCRIVYFSSSYVYSGAGYGAPVSEDHPLKPEHNFGIAKLFFEQLLQRTHPNSVVFRLCSVFGAGVASFPNTIHNFVGEARKQKTITVWGAGRRRVQYVYLGDVVRIVLAAAIGLAPGVYNLGGDDYASVAEAAELVSSIFGANVVFLTDRPEGETLPRLDTTRLRQASGLAFTPLRDAIREYATLSEVSA